MKATHPSNFPERKKSYRPLSSGQDKDKGRGRRHASGQHARIFLPGQPVPETGIYEVIHDKAHRLAHEAVMHGGDPFPVCDHCDLRVRFKLIRTAPYIFDDEDFIEE